MIGKREKKSDKQKKYLNVFLGCGSSPLHLRSAVTSDEPIKLQKASFAKNHNDSVVKWVTMTIKVAMVSRIDNNYDKLSVTIRVIHTILIYHLKDY